MAQLDPTHFPTQGFQIRRNNSHSSWLKDITRVIHGNSKSWLPRAVKEVQLQPEDTHRTLSFRTRYARQILKNHAHKEISRNDFQSAWIGWRWIISLFFTQREYESPLLSRLPTIPVVPSSPETSDEPIKICIIGAGISGLFLGMLLDSLQLPNISYEILEASERVGGRVFTHHFGSSKKDYYDIGAMRFPQIEPLARTFRLFEMCDIDLIPYHYEGKLCPRFFNGILDLHGEDGELRNDPFQLGISSGGLVPDRTVKEGADSILKRAFTPFFVKLQRNFEEGFLDLMKYDHMTTRQYLREEMGLDFYSICYIESTASASGLFDQSLSEAVLDAMDFEYPAASNDEDVKWYRVAEGTYQVIEVMQQRISHKPRLGARVTSIAYQSQDSCEPMRVQIDSEAQHRNYSAVFNTVSLPCMRRMTMGPGTLRPGQRVAIESVHYDASTKVAIKFKSAWWARYCRIYGGQASTDLPIRRCVYPSPDSDSDEPSRILLCSYTWGQDAQQMASLIGNGTKRNELVQLLCHNLALVHQDYVDPIAETPFGYSRMLAIIKDEFEEYHAYDWYSDAYTSGAFAYFGPEQFRHFYPELVRPAANGHMYLVGEACSAHHAWISGSLDSVYRSLTQYLHKLIVEGRVAPYVLDRLQTSWGPLDEIPGEVLEWQMYLARNSTTSQ